MFYKQIDENGKMIAYGEATTVPSNAVEITEEEYRRYVPVGFELELIS